ncbi:MAG: hypothetical protein ACP5IZ_04685 [Thermoprotei archaeon]
MGLDLRMLSEPVELKKKMKQVKNIAYSGSSLNEASYDNLAVWSFNDLPKYFWENWKTELKKHGYTWQKFLSVLKLSTGDIVLWALKDTLQWNELLNRIIKLLEAYTGDLHGQHQSSLW